MLRFGKTDSRLNNGKCQRFPFSEAMLIAIAVQVVGGYATMRVGYTDSQVGSSMPVHYLTQRTTQAPRILPFRPW